MKNSTRIQRIYEINDMINKRTSILEVQIKKLKKHQDKLWKTLNVSSKAVPTFNQLYFID